ncbi:MAG: hypothetical protein A3G08_03450 [Candidatus Magasanikbacteria bacterium RIFCSPLOWO2_12_FULL_47_9b]|nr:MAG: hypothetical protein A3I74_04095 [Candidatus Magasanikbacteria bacterium RIFCSPLOWO2_02_FULL_47_16]OGH79342.1 MAG: hypothetical protein A3C10_04635 [Candidatus Magasanikbacteria bacterium RIFCSPHIGHO2_02_FULL_48_18]OGH83451.1 MAG: hypothetical protein A3G08_03450 [Candidatus Magasanikbacteria bacterium RIFCSPLOWO2_12_FULL_47_9b]
MQNGKIERAPFTQYFHRGFEQILVTAISAPPIVPLVYVGPMNFIVIRSELVPLDAGVEDVQNVVKNLAARNLLFRPAAASREIWINVGLEVLQSHLDRQFTNNDLLWIVLVAHTIVQK